MLKDNKVPGTSSGTRAAEAHSPGEGSAAGFFGDSQAAYQGACSLGVSVVGALSAGLGLHQLGFR